MQRKKKLKQYLILLDLKIINYITNAKNVRHLKPVNGLIKKFPDIHKFCNGDINKFALLLRKGVYPYEYMDSWERFDETSLLDKKTFYSKLYAHYMLYYAHFLSAPGLAWQACLKKTRVEFELLIHIDVTDG